MEKTIPTHILIKSDESEHFNIFGDDLKQIIHLKQSKMISTCFCDEYGRFLLYDKLTESIFEMSKTGIERKSLFNQMIPFSMAYLKKKGFVDEENLLNIQDGKSMTFTIYSTAAKKKYQRNITKIQAFEQDQSFQNQNDLYYKYLKTVVSRIRQTQIIINKEFLNAQDGIFCVNQSHPQIKRIMDEDQEGTLKVMMIETRVAHKPQKFKYDLMREIDQKIIKWEKWISNKIVSKKNLKQS